MVDQPAGPQAGPPIPAEALAAALRPFGQSVMLPAQAYTSAAVLGWELRNFFAGWQCVGLRDGLAGPGCQRAERLGQTTILLVRGADGVLRGFANTCRHRGHELLPCGGSARKRSVVCPYHAWSYTLEGALIAAPGYRELHGFDPAAHALVPVRVQEWLGYVFADPSGRAPSLEEYLGGITALVAGHRTDRLIVRARHEYMVRANWKIVLENYQECYHCPLIHPELCAVSPPDSGTNYDLPGAWVGGWMDLRADTATMSLDGRSGGVPIPGLAEPWLRRVNYLGIFPNLLVSLHPDYVMTHRLTPLGPDSTWVECGWAFPPEADQRNGFDPSYAADFWDVTNRQDWAACESVQRGLASGMARPGPLSPAEDGVYQFVTMVARGYLGHPAHLPTDPVGPRSRERSGGPL